MDRRDKLKSSLGTFLRALCDLMILNLMWIICCLPVFTFGPASSALSRVEIKLVRGESPAVIKEYVSSFRRDFWKAVILGLLGLFGIVVVISDYLFAVSLEGGMRIVFLIVAILVGSIVASYLAYVFCLHAFYENSISGHIRNSLALASSMPLETLKIWICFAVPAVAVLLLPPVAVAYLGSLYVLLAVSAPAWFAAKQQTKVLARFDSTQNTNEHPDED